MDGRQSRAANFWEKDLSSTIIYPLLVIYIYIYFLNMHIHVCNHPEVDTVVFKETTNRFYLSDDFLDISIFYLLQNDHIIIYIHLFIYLFIYFSV